MSAEQPYIDHSAVHARTLQQRWHALRAWAETRAAQDTLISLQDLLFAMQELENPSNDLVTDVLDCARRDRPIEGIKLLRERTGMYLKDAKDKYESIVRDAGLPPPNYNRM